MPAIAVTGANGFIGRRLIERLCRDGVAVRALMRRRPIETELDGGDLTIVKGSLNDNAAITSLIDGVDAVIHLAGLIKARTRQAFFDANAEGTRHLASIAAARPRPPKLLLVSSLAAREPALSSYAASKRAGEEALSTLGDTLPWTILRPPAVYGPGDPETLSFFKGAKRGFGIMLGNDQARFSLLHVDDLIDLILTVLDPRTADQLVLEPDDGREGGHDWRGMIAAAEQAFGRKVLRLRIPKTLLSALGLANAGLRILPGYTPMLTPEKVRELSHQDWVADRRQILAATEWRPAIPVDRGFPATIDWYRLHSWL
ncbi:MAG: NAD-dependent epimerase/dehydratase family protein [Alphaproteobacteria bacterium]|nr:NAD-dependent epimerase/dehydratase family protein [Alphaproteobacteria bacterium]